MSSERQAFNEGFDKGYAKAIERIAQLEAKLVRLDVEMLTTDDDGNPVGCGMDLLDWQAHLQTELGITHLKVRQLEAANKQTRTLVLEAYMKSHGDALKEIGPILKAALVALGGE